MPRPDGTLYAWERAQINSARTSYCKAVDEVKRHPQSKAVYESLEKKAFAHLLTVTTRYSGCR